MAGKLKDKSAVVTGGGTGGLGSAVALAMAEEGANVVVNDIARDSEGVSLADKVVDEIKKANGTAVSNCDSVATMAGAENIVKTAVDNFGKIDILVNCAGNAMNVKIFEMTEEQFDSIITVHLKGHFNCIKAAGQEMAKQKSGRIINFSSRGAFFGGANPAYNAAKAGILGLNAMLSVEFEKLGITVNTIMPSADTKLFPGKGPRPIGDNMPDSMWKELDYVAPIVVYLATDDAYYITGRIIYSSGGDLCVYAKPLMLPGGEHMFVRKMGKWTVDEIHEVLSSMLK